MKALVLAAYNRFELQERPTPEIGPDDVLLKVAACGICGSDVHGMDGSSGRRRPPIIMGHEAAGVIARLGGNVADWAEGERVTFDSTINCGKCWFCRRGQINLCDHRAFSASHATNAAAKGLLPSTWPCRSTFSIACPIC